MSHSLTDRVRRRVHGDDEGFGLIEIMIAMLIFGIVIVSTAPLLVGGLRAGRISQLNLQGKALGQERLEIMRNLPYHVARQNGQYLDILDLFFRDIAPVGVLATNDVCAARVYTAATATYTCRIDALGADYPGFFQTVQTQFLTFERAVVTPGLGYSSQTAGVDSPVSALLGVVVTTSWPQNGTTKSFAVRSQIANGQPEGSLITADLQVSALNLASNLADGDLLQLEAGLVSSSGSLTTGSTSRLSAVAARAAKASGTEISGASFSVSAPPAAAGTSPSEPLGKSLDGTCVLACFSQTSISGDQSVIVASGQPKASSSASPVLSALRRTGANTFRGYTYNNTPAGSVDALLGLTGPMVSGGNGSTTDVAVGSGYLDATGTGATAVRSSGSTTLPVLQLFPTLFAPLGVVQVELTAASVTCTSGGGTGAISASWSGTVRYWTDNLPGSTTQNPLSGYVPVPLAPGATQLPDPADVSVNAGRTLDTWVKAWSALTATGTVDQSSGRIGKATVPAVLSMLTAPTRTSDPTSAINIAVGALRCQAEDNR